MLALGVFTKACPAAFAAKNMLNFCIHLTEVATVEQIVVRRKHTERHTVSRVHAECCWQHMITLSILSTDEVLDIEYMCQLLMYSCSSCYAWYLHVYTLLTSIQSQDISLSCDPRPSFKRHHSCTSGKEVANIQA
jgi:hypothetical protein